VAADGIWDGHTNNHCCYFALCCVTLQNDFQEHNLNVLLGMTRPNTVPKHRLWFWIPLGHLGWMFICAVLSCV